jgi:hypothetical protein
MGLNNYILSKAGIIMKESNSPQENTIPNIHVPENERVLAYLKEMHPFKEIILPFSEKRVSQDTVPADLIGRFSSMSSLPENSKYVVYGREALVHPQTGIIFGFITGTSVIYRLPEHLLQEVREGNISNFRIVNENGGNNMGDLESNWVTSRSITEQLVAKCFEYYGQSSPEPEVVHLNFDLDLTTPRTREFEEQERSRRMLPLAMLVGVFVLVVVLWYAANYFITGF